MRGELRSAAVPPPVHASVAESILARLRATMTDPDLQLIVGFCTIGYLVAIDAILRFPDFGGLVASLAIFP